MVAESLRNVIEIEGVGVATCVLSRHVQRNDRISRNDDICSSQGTNEVNSRWIVDLKQQMSAREVKETIGFERSDARAAMELEVRGAARDLVDTRARRGARNASRPLRGTHGCPWLLVDSVRDSHWRAIYRSSR